MGIILQEDEEYFVTKLILVGFLTFCFKNHSATMLRQVFGRFGNIVIVAFALFMLWVWPDVDDKERTEKILVFIFVAGLLIYFLKTAGDNGGGLGNVGGGLGVVGGGLGNVGGVGGVVGGGLGNVGGGLGGVGGGLGVVGGGLPNGGVQHDIIKAPEVKEPDAFKVEIKITPIPKNQKGI